jgi:hypothetical protein
VPPERRRDFHVLIGGVTTLFRIDSPLAPTAPAPSTSIRFCSRCGDSSEEPVERVERHRRICDQCGMGMLLTCSHDALTDTAAAFLICTFELTVSAVSESAERIFGAEDAILGQSLLDVVTSPLGSDHVARYASLAAQRPSDPVVMPVRPVAAEGEQAGILTARIATCGPPRAALVTVEPSGFGRR